MFSIYSNWKTQYRNNNSKNRFNGQSPGRLGKPVTECQTFWILLQQEITKLVVMTTATLN